MVLNYNKIKLQIERNLCPEHSQHPVFTKTTNGFTIDACCEKFRNFLVKQAEKAIKEETERTISEMFTKAFKK